MKGLFQGSGAKAQSKPGESWLSLAAFGKHPGWDDHISGIGVETEALAHVKQSLYVGGIGRQIDLGAWEKLDSVRRVEGFDHTFFWFRGGHVVLGRFWSSVDRKGRAKYPMVLCVDGEGVAPGFLMARGGAELERLRESCKATDSAAQVTAECGAAQDRLRTALQNASAEMPVTMELKRRFLESPALGADRVGLLRVLHELDNALGVSSGNRANGAAALANLHPYHIRVPLCLASPNEGLLVWSEFLRGVLPHSVPLMLIARNGVDWLDVIVGEPSGDDFFCLQASPQALPLATEIPYELGPDLYQRFQEMESRFLAPEAGADEGGTIFIKKPSAGASGGGTSPPRKSKGWLWMVIGLVVVGAAVAGIYLALPGPDKKFQSHLQAAHEALDATNFTLARQEIDLALKSRPDDPAATKFKTEMERRQREFSDLEQADRKYREAMAAAQAAFDQNDFRKADHLTVEALKIKPNDSAAIKLKDNADARQREIAAQAENDSKYKQAMEAAGVAMGKQDYATAVTQAEMALVIKPNDPAAIKLKDDVQARQRELASLAASDSKYKLAMETAGAAMATQDYAAVVVQADLALAIKPNDSAANKLKNDAQTRQREIAAQADVTRKYQQAMAEGRAAFERKDYAAAMTRADAALAIKPGDSAAVKIKADAEARQRELVAQADATRKYRQAMSDAQAAFGRQDYDAAITQAETALATQPNDSAAGDLLSQARQAKAAKEPAALAEKQHIPPLTPVNQAPLVVASATTTTTTATGNQAGAGGTQSLSVDQYDMALRNLMIQLRVRAAGPNILTNGGTSKPLARGFLPADSIDQYGRDIETLRKIYQDNKWLDAERKKDLEKLGDAILNWN